MPLLLASSLPTHALVSTPPPAPCGAARRALLFGAAVVSTHVHAAHSSTPPSHPTPNPATYTKYTLLPLVIAGLNPSLPLVPSSHDRHAVFRVAQRPPSLSPPPPTYHNPFAPLSCVCAPHPLLLPPGSKQQHSAAPTTRVPLSFLLPLATPLGVFLGWVKQTSSPLPARQILAYFSPPPHPLPVTQRLAARTYLPPH